MGDTVPTVLHRVLRPVEPDRRDDRFELAFEIGARAERTVGGDTVGRSVVATFVALIVTGSLHRLSSGRDEL